MKSLSAVSLLNRTRFVVASSRVLSILAASVCFLMMSSVASAQLTGAKTIPGDYASVAAAVTDLNTQGVGAGGVTFTVADDYTETAPAGGFAISNPAGNGAGNPIVFQRAGTGGASPAFTANAALTSGALNDAIFKIIGTDNLTISGFQMLENPANTTTAAGTNNMTEWGVALLYVTSTNGSQNITIQNCSIDLDRTYQNTFGIYSNSTHTPTAVTTSATATTTAGGNSGLKIYGNSITDVNIGIVVVGPTAAADHNEVADIGGVALVTGNSITNYGTTGTFSGYANVSGTVNGILVRNTRNFNVSFNTVTSSAGGTTAGTLNGIQVPVFSNAPTGTMTNSINNNIISVSSGAAGGAINGINVLGTSASTTTTLNINNNDFNNVGHTVAGTAAITLLSNAGAPQHTNINNNTFTNLSLNTTGSVTFISNSTTNSSATGTKNVNNNSIVTAFSKTGAGGTITLFTDNGSDVNGAINNSNNNNFSNITVTGATIIAGWLNTNGGTPTKTVTGNTFSNWVGGTSAITGLAVSFSGTSNVSNNLVSNITSAGAITGITSGSGTVESFSQNTVHTLTTTGTGTVTGMSNTGGSTKNFFRNKIYNLENSNAAGAVNGVLVSAGTTVNVFNNLIGDLRTPAVSAANALNGINVTSTSTTTNINVSFNTVYLSATSTGANFGSSAIFHTASATATTASLTSRDNIFVNLSTPNGTGLTVAYRRSGVALDNYNSASNNNDFFAGTPGATRLIFFDGTNSDQTLAQYKARVTPRDSASVTENPNFLSTTGANANFLHINAAIATQLESGGTPVSGITDDYDGETRNATNPDIGADEFAGTALDLSAPSITYTPFTNTTSTGDRPLTVTITDPSGVAGGANSPRIYFRKNAGAYFSTQCTGSSPTYTCTIDNGLVGGVTSNDVIDYFVVAQDTLGNVGANPSAGFAATDVNNVTSPPTTPNTYTIVAGFPISTNVGTGEAFTSLTNPGGVFAALNAGVLTDNITINVTTDLTAETGAVALNQLIEEEAGAGTYTVIIKPFSAARVISGTNATGALIRLNGADRVTIDGSTSGGIDRSLTITNNSAATNTAAIHIISLGTGAGANNITVKNTNLSCGADQTTSTSVTYGISQGNNLLGNSGADNDNNSFINNAITRVNIGIYSSGASAANQVQNTVITDNLIGPAAFGIDQIGRAGIIFNQTNNATVTGNEVRFVGVLDSQVSDGGSYDKFGISHAFNGWSETTFGDLFVSNTLIARNKVHDIVEENTFSAVGIFMAGGNSTNDTLNRTVNNFIWNVRANGTFGDNSASLGIASGKADTVAFNSIYMAGDIDPLVSFTADTSSFGIQITSTTVVNLTLKDNISFADMTSNTPALRHGSIKIPASFVWGTGGSDFNDLYVPAANPQAIVGRVGATNAVTFANWQTASGQDANSKSVDPLFVSATNLHLQGASPLVSMGIAIAGITDDIDGDARPAANPEIGADELINAGDLIISEFRLRGPGGSGMDDEFIELYNTTGAVLTVQAVDASAGLAVAASDGVARCVVPNGTVIPARGHVLCANPAGYSLSGYPAGNGTLATEDFTYATEIPDNAGIAIFNNSTGGASFSLANRLDAVGSASEANLIYKEGTGYPDLISAHSNDYSFVRNMSSGLPKDTGDNLADFVFVETTGGCLFVAGCASGVTADGLITGRHLGAPGPENLTSPIQRNATIKASLIDNSCSSSSGAGGASDTTCARHRDTTPGSPNTSTLGTLSIRRNFKNNTGGAVTQLRFRVVDVTTLPPGSGIADLRLLTSSSYSATCVGTGGGCSGAGAVITINGTTLETPPAQSGGGGINSSVAVGTITLGTPLAQGASINLQFLLGVQTGGSFRFFINVEALP